MSDVGIYTNDLRLFYHITKKFKSENFEFNALDDFRCINPSTKVLITTQSDLDLFDPDIPDYIDVIIVLPSYSLDEIMLRTCQHLKNIPTAREITISLDPGTVRTGLAIFLDGYYLYSTEFTSLDRVRSFIQEIFGIYPNPSKMIKIGNGYSQLTKRFLKALIVRQVANINVHYSLVNERFTSNSSRCKKIGVKSVHEQAAILIGRRKGKIVTGF
ncbi:hypothetical protein [Candidatus Lokiarchaeum ossiferum]